MDLKSKVISIIVEQLGVTESQVTTEAHFIDDLGADSLDTVELILSFEEAFDISIPDEDAESLETVGVALDYLKNHIEE